MKRLYLALVLAALAGTPAAAADAPVLHSTATVEADVVRIGDIWENAGDKAGIIIARAPAPGRRAVLDAQWLTEVARGYGIPWHPVSRYDRITVERASQVVDRTRILAEVTAALATQQSLPADIEVEIANGDLRLHLPADTPATLAVRDLTFDERSRRFTAVIETPVERVRVAGVVHTITELPVLARPIARGEVISAADIEWRRMRSDRLQRDVVADAAPLVGQAARHALRAGSPLRAGDVQRPVVVAKGSLVTMVLKAGALTITAQGRAAEDGGEGDVIRILNTQSNHAVEARVEGPSMVSVMPSTYVVAN